MARLEGAPITGDLLVTSFSPTPIGLSQPILGQSVGFHTSGAFPSLSIAPSRFLAPRISASASMLLSEQKSFERFVKFAPPRFDGTSGDGACLFIYGLVFDVLFLKSWSFSLDLFLGSCHRMRKVRY